MGDSVDVRVENANGQQRKLIDTELEKYQYGRFNGMEDIYEYSNTREDIPQTKYLSINYHYTADYQQAAYDWTKAHYMDSEQLSTMPELYEDADSNTRLHNEWLSTIIYQVLNGSKTRYEGKEARTFWDDYKPAKPAPKLAPKVEAGEVHEIMHTKKGVNIYIVTLPTDVDGETGGRYYVVRKGDNGFWAISKAVFRTPRRWQEIAALNPGVNSARLKPGQKVWVPKIAVETVLRTRRERPLPTLRATAAVPPAWGGIGAPGRTALRDGRIFD